jgi:hypothetical protein
MTRQEFYEELNNSITVSCSLPFSIPEKALDNIVKYAHQWFVRNYEDAVENIYISIPKEVWSNDIGFKTSRTLQLPKCVYSVHAVAKDKSSKNRSAGYADFSIDKYLFSNWGVNGGFGGVENTTQSDAVLGFVIASSWGDLTDHILNYPISYNYSRQTNKLFLKGSVQDTPDFLLDVDIMVPVEALFDSDLFFRYCEGYAKMSLSNIMGTFGMTLPGNATINYDRYHEQGSSQIEEVKAEIKDMSSGSSFFMHTGAL